MDCCAPKQVFFQDIEISSPGYSRMKKTVPFIFCNTPDTKSLKIKMKTHLFAYLEESKNDKKTVSKKHKRPVK